MEFRVQGKRLGSYGLGFRVQSNWFRVRSTGSRIPSSEFMVYGQGSRDLGFFASALRVSNYGLRVYDQMIRG